MQTKIRKKTGQIYQELLAGISYTTPHKFIATIYEKYKTTYKSNPSVNGTILEYLVCETLAQQNITPFYYQATFEHIPNA